MRIIFGIVVTFFVLSSFLYSEEEPNSNKKIIYKKHTELDFSGETVQGKIRAPEIFYIFQRKRTGGHDAVEYPKDFKNHNEETKKIVKELLGE